MTCYFQQRIILLLCTLAASAALVAAPKPSFEGAWWAPGMTRKGMRDAPSGFLYEPDFILFQRGDRICGYWKYFATTRSSGYVQAKVRPNQPNIADFTYVCGYSHNAPYRGLRSCPGWFDEPTAQSNGGWIKAVDGPFMLCGNRLHSFGGGVHPPKGENPCKGRETSGGYKRRKISAQQLTESYDSLDEIRKGLAECLAGKDPSPEWIKPSMKW